MNLLSQDGSLVRLLPSESWVENLGNSKLNFIISLLCDISKTTTFCVLELKLFAHVTKIAVWGRLGVRKIEVLWSLENQSWINFSDRIARLRKCLQGSYVFVQLSLMVLDCPRWADPLLCLWLLFGNGKIMTCLYQLVRPKGSNFEHLNRIWQFSFSDEVWSKIWTHIWYSYVAVQARIFLRRVLVEGLFTGAHASRIGVDTGDCLLCPGVLETMPHIF